VFFGLGCVVCFFFARFSKNGECVGGGGGGGKVF